jgi:hypothetical protein
MTEKIKGSQDFFFFFFLMYALLAQGQEYVYPLRLENQKKIRQKVTVIFFYLRNTFASILTLPLSNKPKTFESHQLY